MSEDPDLRTKFANIAFLLCLVILFNRDYYGHRSLYAPKTFESNHANLHALEAVAAILGLHGKGITACYIAQTATILIAESPAYTMDLNDTGDNIMTPVTFGRKEGHYPVQIDKPQYAGNLGKLSAESSSNPHNLRTVGLENATDFWPVVQSDEWHCAFK